MKLSIKVGECQPGEVRPDLHDTRWGRSKGLGRSTEGINAGSPLVERAPGYSADGLELLGIGLVADLDIDGQLVDEQTRQ